MTNKVITETLEMGLKIIEQREEIDRLTAEVERLEEAISGIIDKSRSWPILPPEGDGLDIYAAHIIKLRKMAEEALRSET